MLPYNKRNISRHRKEAPGIGLLEGEIYPVSGGKSIYWIIDA
jgi:hypothetical protein